MFDERRIFTYATFTANVADTLMTWRRVRIQYIRMDNIAIMALEQIVLVSVAGCNADFRSELNDIEPRDGVPNIDHM